MAAQGTAAESTKVLGHGRVSRWTAHGGASAWETAATSLPGYGGWDASAGRRRSIGPPLGGRDADRPAPWSAH
ncbi:hypothetical protein GLE_3085 [Lysobacter enzymogenes]|uniref:Uncharacterized protein n=1 Tax=Lysobacter enzymogenes TaxID=69 RepID=A0A0S2DIV4_LYSEN|nr:hypothetical protein GLE_3085 [Lysobacter enzymogenes]